MKVRSKKDFFQVLKKSRLLSPDERVSARAASQGISEPETIARQLIESGRLTRWQAGQLLAGKTRFFLGKYKLLKVCGRGGMGVVFKAEQPEIQRMVAIKVLHRSLLSKPRAVSRFMREMRLAASLSHPNLVVAYDADQTRDTHYLVMEYVSGKSLKYYSQKHGQMPIGWSCDCIRQASLGLAHIHERGLVHRDIKPSNLLVIHDPLSKQPRIKILDVGLSRFVSESEEDEGLTKAGQILGTMDYMAPEQIKDARTADIHADIFSLGATLFQLLTGAPPLAGKTLMQTYVARMTQAAPPVSQFRSNVPPALDALVARMLERDPEQRYHAPSQVVEDLAAIISSGNVDSRPRTASSGASESASRMFNYESSADEESVELTGSERDGRDESLLQFLDQLSQDELANCSSILSEDVLNAGNRRRAGISSWGSVVLSVQSWFRSILQRATRETSARSANKQRRLERDRVNSTSKRLRKRRKRTEPTTEPIASSPTDRLASDK